jgi:hypothetical protein
MEDVVKTFIDNIINNTDANYFEIFILSLQSQDTSKYNKSVRIVPTALTSQEFYNLMRSFSQIANMNNYKFFQKDCKEIYVDNVIYRNFNNEEITVYNLRSIDSKISDGQMCLNAFCRTKSSMLNVSSTQNVYCEKYVRTLSFRISNRIQLNFSCTEEASDKSYNVYVTYQHEKNVDLHNNITVLTKILKGLLT